MSNKVIKGLFIATGLLVFMGTLAGVSLKLTSSPAFCTLCHEIKPEFSTWQASSHSKVTCSQCHQRPGLRNLVAEKRTAVEQLYRHFAKEFYLPISSPEPIPNERCLRCHKMNRPVSAKGDLKMNHLKHLRRKIDCVECHRGVAHGRIAERQMTIDAAWDRWTEAYGKVQMNPQFTSLQMKDCVNCHTARKAPLTCETCHKEIAEPPSHRQPVWGTGHGKEARKDLDGCDKCHSFTKEFQVINVKDPVTEYARTNKLCYDCHLKRPSRHGDDWKKVHPQEGKSNKEGCPVCHSYQPPRSTEKATKTYCQACHRRQHRYFNRQVHPIPVPEGTKLQKMCFKCHNDNTCGKCHYLDFTAREAKPVSSQIQPDIN